MRIALFPNEEKKQAIDIAKQIIVFCKNKNIDVIAEDSKATLLNVPFLSSINKKDVNYLIAIGGDGTILRIFHQYKDLECPILGINIGGLGFMNDVPVKDLFLGLQELIDKKYRIENRMTIEGSFEQKTPIVASNDIVVHRGANHGLIETTIHINDIYFNSFLSDGMIIATPNGSTAYSLSAGGPIITPYLQAILITPVSPHTISNRPIVISAEDTISITCSHSYDNPIDIRFDGFPPYSIKPNEKLVIKKSKKIFKLVKLFSHDYFSTLRLKLSWLGKMK